MKHVDETLPDAAAPCAEEPAQAADRSREGPTPGSLGAQVRTERARQGISLRELARRASVSPSMVSQIERGLVMPSVSTLWSIASELNMTLEGLFSEPERAAPPAPDTPPPGAVRDGGPIQRLADRKSIRLAGGVVWGQLATGPGDEVEFLHAVYEPGAESCPEDSLFRHGGREYAYVLSGRLGLQIGFEKYELTAGDSATFSAQTPHRLWAVGDEPAVAIWVVINRTNDARTQSSPPS